MLNKLQGYDNCFYTFDYADVSQIVFTKTAEKFADVCNNLMAFDSETSNGVEFHGNALGFVPYKYENNKKYRELIDNNKHFHSVSCMYMWQWTIENGDQYISFIGRTYEDLIDFVNRLTREVKRQMIFGNKYPNSRQWEEVEKRTRYTQLLIWIHNFSFDFAILSNIFAEEFARCSTRKDKQTGATRKTSHTFARDSRRPMKAIAIVDKVKFEFRDSYVLVNKSLAAWGDDEHLTVQKIKQDEDYYLKIRTPKTPLTDAELEYAIIDTVTMIEGLKKFRDKYGRNTQIPLTQTGCVRRKYQQNLKLKDPDWQQLCYDINKGYTYDSFKLQCHLYTGGWVHANKRYCKKKITAEKDGPIINHDYASAYPFVLTTCPSFPVSEFKKIDVTEFDKLKDRYPWGAPTVWFGLFEFDTLQQTTANSFFSLSKLYEKPLKTQRIIEDNGRIAKTTGKVKLLLSDFDWDTFKQAYKWKGMNVIDLYEAKAGRLSPTFVETLLKDYATKTSMKGQNLTLYNGAKVDCNCSYGIAVQKIIGNNVEYTIDGWGGDNSEEAMRETFDNTIAGLKPEKVILAYQMGVWVCKAACWNLWRMILHYDKETIYCDTDSLKGLLKDLTFIDNYNEWVKAEEEKAAQDLGIDVGLWAPKTPKGETKRLGVFEREHDCFTFATLGAKRYYCEFYSTNKKTGVKYKDRETTIAGLPKSAGKKMIHSAEEFLKQPTFTVEESQKKMAIYNDNQGQVKWIDYLGNSYITDEKYGCAIIPTTFDLAITPKFDKLLKLIEDGYSDENIFNDTPWELLM